MKINIFDQIKTLVTQVHQLTLNNWIFTEEINCIQLHNPKTGKTVNIFTIEELDKLKTLLYESSQ